VVRVGTRERDGDRDAAQHGAAQGGGNDFHGRREPTKGVPARQKE
jgi:hypothetical protein